MTKEEAAEMIDWVDKITKAERAGIKQTFGHLIPDQD
jgi:hypothetical protein